MIPATVLVVDDEPDLEALVLQLYRREIESGMIRFGFARDGEEALARLEQDAFDVVLSDINMPRMDGLTLLERLAAHHDELRAVIISAYGDIDNIRAAMNLGAFDFLTKPIDFEDLKVTLVKAQKDVKRLRAANDARIDAERGQANLARYFSPQLAKQLLADGGKLVLGGDRRELSFVFTDIANFTTLVESSEPNVVISLINEYIDNMTRIVFEHEGTVDKIVGDAVHAIFGAPVRQPDHAGRAVACALALDGFAEVFRAEQVSKQIAFGTTRIGVHSGPAVVGNFGGESYFDYTAHGDAVNTAARLESANKLLGTRVCVSAAVVERLSGFHGRPVGHLVLKGKTEGVDAFELLSAEQDQSPQTRAYKEAFLKLEARDPAAQQAFAALVGEYGDDPLATFHLKRLLAGQQGTRIALNEN